MTRPPGPHLTSTSARAYAGPGPSGTIAPPPDHPTTALPPAAPADDPASRDRLAEALHEWLDTSDLAPVRHPIAVGLLPPDERDAWRQLWADARSLRDRPTPP